MAKTVAGRIAGAAPAGMPPTDSTTTALHGIGLGTEVLTLDGALPVEFLTPGDRIVTRTGARRVAQITTTRLVGPLIRIAPGSLGHGRPGQALMLTPETPVLLRDWRAQVLYGAPTALVPAARLVDGEFVAMVPAEGLALFTLHFDRAEIIHADGVAIGCAPVHVAT